jgi:hypothetical protein
MQVDFFVDEVKKNSVSFTFERGYRDFKAYFNGKHIGDIEGGIPSMKKGKIFETENGDKISVKLKIKEKSYFLVEFNDIPIPSSPEYPAKRLKKAAAWSLTLGILGLLGFTFLVIQTPFVLSYPIVYIDVIIPLTYILCFFGIRKYIPIALYAPIVLTSLILLYTWTDPFEIHTDRGLIAKINLSVILNIIGLIVMTRSIKPMKQIQEIRRRLAFDKNKDIIDNL